MPEAMPVMMFRPTSPQFTLVNPFQMERTMAGIWLMSCGMALARPPARVMMICAPACRICGRFEASVLTIDAMICGM